MLKVLLVDDTPDRASALKDALSQMEGVDVACTLESPLQLLRRVAEHAPDVVLIDTESPSRDVLEQLAADSRAAGYGIHDVFDALVKFRSARPPAGPFVQSLARLQPRLYSIASSLREHPGEVHLTVGVVRYDLNGRGYQGLGSGYFAEHLRAGRPVPVFVQKAHGFALPADPNTPIVMVGPGTGIAPFRAFLQERAAAKAGGPCWLFFGDQHAARDFLYRDELAAWGEARVLTRLSTAFSRDQAEKIYVQHRMLEEGEELWRWLAQGAHLYVCGDAKRMAADVEHALCEVVARHGAMAKEDAARHVKEMAKAGRYQRDVY